MTEHRRRKDDHGLEGAEKAADSILESIAALTLARVDGQLVAFRRRTVKMLAVVIGVAMLVTAYSAVAVHERYRTRCIEGPLLFGTAQPGWCSYLFPEWLTGNDPDRIPQVRKDLGFDE